MKVIKWLFSTSSLNKIDVFIIIKICYFSLMLENIFIIFCFIPWAVISSIIEVRLENKK